MLTSFKDVKHWCLSKIFTIFLMVSFITNTLGFGSMAFAQAVLGLPIPGTMVLTSPIYSPALIQGVNIDLNDPLNFDFIIDQGNMQLSEQELHQESEKLIKYFLAALTIPEKDMWVNLSPYEENRIIPQGFGETTMGRDLLALDYMLKQLSSSLLNPDQNTGETFWNRIHENAYESFGTTDLPMDTFNKIWIVPQDASLYEHSKGAFVVKSRLKVMLEEDYFALQSSLELKNPSAQMPKSQSSPENPEAPGNVGTGELTKIQTQLMREIILPEIEKEVNEGKTFANLRQIYHSVILATWYKQALSKSLLGQLYVNQNKTSGVDTEDKEINQKIYEQYVAAFRKGVTNIIKEDFDPQTQELIPRRYFTGGANLNTPVKVANGTIGKNIGKELTNDDAMMTATFSTMQMFRHLVDRIKPVRVNTRLSPNHAETTAVVGKNIEVEVFPVNSDAPIGSQVAESLKKIYSDQLMTVDGHPMKIWKMPDGTEEKIGVRNGLVFIEKEIWIKQGLVSIKKVPNIWITPDTGIHIYRDFLNRKDAPLKSMSEENVYIDIQERNPLKELRTTDDGVLQIGLAGSAYEKALEAFAAKGINPEDFFNLENIKIVNADAAMTSKNKKVLVVDKDLTWREKIARNLTELAFEVVTAKDWLEAWEIYENQEFDLVVTDLEMPGSTGLDLAKKVERAGHGTPVLLISENYATLETLLKNPKRYQALDGTQEDNRPHNIKRFIGKYSFSAKELQKAVKVALSDKATMMPEKDWWKSRAVTHVMFEAERMKNDLEEDEEKFKNFSDELFWSVRSAVENFNQQPKPLLKLEEAIRLRINDYSSKNYNGILVIGREEESFSNEEKNEKVFSKINEEVRLFGIPVAVQRSENKAYFYSFDKEELSKRVLQHFSQRYGLNQERDGIPYGIQELIADAKEASGRLRLKASTLMVETFIKAAIQTTKKKFYDEKSAPPLKDTLSEILNAFQEDFFYLFQFKLMIAYEEAFREEQDGIYFFNELMLNKQNRETDTIDLILNTERLSFITQRIADFIDNEFRFNKDKSLADVAMLTQEWDLLKNFSAHLNQMFAKLTNIYSVRHAEIIAGKSITFKKTIENKAIEQKIFLDSDGLRVQEITTQYDPESTGSEKEILEIQTEEMFFNENSIEFKFTIKDAEGKVIHRTEKRSFKESPCPKVEWLQDGLVGGKIRFTLSQAAYQEMQELGQKDFLSFVDFKEDVVDSAPLINQDSQTQLLKSRAVTNIVSEAKRMKTELEGDKAKFNKFMSDLMKNLNSAIKTVNNNKASGVSLMEAIRVSVNFYSFETYSGLIMIGNEKETFSGSGENEKIFSEINGKMSLFGIPVASQRNNGKFVLEKFNKVALAKKLLTHVSQRYGLDGTQDEISYGVKELMKNAKEASKTLRVQKGIVNTGIFIKETLAGLILKFSEQKESLDPKAMLSNFMNLFQIEFFHHYGFKLMIDYENAFHEELDGIYFFNELVLNTKAPETNRMILTQNNDHLALIAPHIADFINQEFGLKKGEPFPDMAMLTDVQLHVLSLPYGHGRWEDYFTFADMIGKFPHISREEIYADLENLVREGILERSKESRYTYWKTGLYPKTDVFAQDMKSTLMSKWMNILFRLPNEMKQPGVKDALLDAIEKIGGNKEQDSSVKALKKQMQDVRKEWEKQKKGRNALNKKNAGMRQKDNLSDLFQAMDQHITAIEKALKSWNKNLEDVAMITSIKVLIVDDNRNQRQLVQMDLEDMFGNTIFEIFTARDGKDALEIIEKEGKFDFIVTDLQMPRLSGLDLCNKIQDQFGKDLPIIMVTGERGHMEQIINNPENYLDPEGREKGKRPENIVKLIPKADYDELFVDSVNSLVAKIKEDRNTSGKKVNTGGIDLNALLMEMNIEKEGSGIEFPPIDPKKIENMQINGLTPIIINVTPINNVLPFLGLNEPVERYVVKEEDLIKG